MRAALHVLSTIVIAMSCAGPSSPPSAPSPPEQPAPLQPPVRVLMVTTTAGFRHDSIPTARRALTGLGAETGEFTVAATEDLGDLTAARLGAADVLMFALTSGELPFDESQKAAIVSFVNGGGGFIGVHSATDTLYQWPDYGNLVGAYFKEHPWTQEATVVVEDRTHPITSGLGGSFRLMEEFYTFQQNPRASVHVLLSLNAASVQAQGDFPLSWSRSFGRGRSYYNALGHFSATWTDARFQAQLRSAIRWVAQR